MLVTCALPGCETPVEQRIDGRSRPRYCCAAHRHRARHIRNVTGDQKDQAQLNTAS
jgi:hypothetical protein